MTIMEKRIVQLTSGKGPIECARVVAKVQALLMKEAKKVGISVEVLTGIPGDVKGTLLSTVLRMEGNSLERFLS